MWSGKKREKKIKREFEQICESINEMIFYIHIMLFCLFSFSSLVLSSFFFVCQLFVFLCMYSVVCCASLFGLFCSFVGAFGQCVHRSEFSFFFSSAISLFLSLFLFRSSQFFSLYSFQFHLLDHEILFWSDRSLLKLGHFSLVWK